MPTTRFNILLIGYIASRVRGFSCGAEPMVLEYGFTNLDSGVQVFGAPIVLGGQKLAAVVMPDSSYLNQYMFPGYQDCNITDKLALCVDPYTFNDIRWTADDFNTQLTSDGGFFDNFKSSTYEGPRFGDSFDEETIFSPLPKDTYQIGSVQLPNTTFAASTSILNKEWIPSYSAMQNWLGLRGNSTLLNSLVDGDFIPSKVWSFWGGWTSSNSSLVRKGSLVLGGYHDLGNANTTEFGLESTGYGCSLEVDVTNMMFGIGSETNITSVMGGGKVTACIDPSYDGMLFPDDIYDYILYLAGVDPDDTFAIYNYDERASEFSWGYSVRTVAIPQTQEDWYLSIEINGAKGLKVKIPPHQLVHDPKIITKNGFEFNTNVRRKTLRMTNFSSQVSDSFTVSISTSPLVLGLPFLSGVYLTVDHYNTKFGLTPLSDPDILSSTTIRPVYAGTCARPQRSIIIGATIGASFFCVLVGGVVFLWLRRRRIIHRSLGLEKFKGGEGPSLRSITGSFPDVPVQYVHQLHSDQVEPRLLDSKELTSIQIGTGRGFQFGDTTTTSRNEIPRPPVELP
ncbi:hypothetical protein ABW19_dt0200128 [Dactylella cylindrospora]|nr:hypothetical protein ABW19_dt0200128 [Dactylella cylindrospora]